MTDPLRELQGDEANLKCEWQTCQNRAAFMRDTTWGELPVCETHAREPLFENEEGSQP